MTDRSKPHVKDPRGGWRAGKSYKHSTNKLWRAINKACSGRKALQPLEDQD